MSDKISWDLDDGRVVQISYTLSTDFNIDEIVSIDINNLLGEYLTAPVLFNTIANLRTTAMEILAKKRLQIKIIEKELYKAQKRKSNSGAGTKLTEKAIEANIESDPVWLEVQEELIEAEKNNGMLDNLYWSVKEKCNKLDNLYHKISPEEFNKEIMEGQVNNVMVKLKKALIK